MENAKKRSNFISEEEFNILIDYANGKSASELEREYGIARKRLDYLVGTKKFGFILRERQKAIKNTIRRAFSRVDNKYIQLVDKYMDRLLDDERIDKTPLLALSSIIESLSNNYKKIAEIRTLDNRVIIESKKYELEKKKILLELETKYNLKEDGKKDIPIVEDFYNKLLELATPNLKEDGFGDLSNTEFTNEKKKLEEQIGKVNKELNKIDAEKYPYDGKAGRKPLNKENTTHKHDSINI